MVCGMDQSAFYGIVSGISFTLQGLWWVAVRERPDLLGGDVRQRRTAYLVGLNFAVLATVSLFAQVAPDVPMVWRVSFGAAGVIGAVGLAMLGMGLRRTPDLKIAGTLIAAFGVPVYAAITAVAVLSPAIARQNWTLRPIQIEALLVAAMAFIGVQIAWAVGMTRPRP